MYKLIYIYIFKFQAARAQKLSSSIFELELIEDRAARVFRTALPTACDSWV